MRAIVFSLCLLFSLLACQSDQMRQEYDALNSLSDEELSRVMCQKPPKEFVGMLLFAVEENYPSNYRFAPKTCLSAGAVAEMGNQLDSAKTSRTAFALVYGIHRSGQPLPSGFSAKTGCLKHFSAYSPCYDLAREIDVRKH